MSTCPAARLRRVQPTLPTFSSNNLINLKYFKMETPDILESQEMHATQETHTEKRQRESSQEGENKKPKIVSCQLLPKTRLPQKSKPGELTKQETSSRSESESESGTESDSESGTETGESGSEGHEQVRRKKRRKRDFNPFVAMEAEVDEDEDDEDDDEEDGFDRGTFFSPSTPLPFSLSRMISNNRRL